MKKTIALILATVMLLALAVPMVVASEGEVADGTLLKDVDFSQLTLTNSSSYTLGTQYEAITTTDALELKSTNLSNKEIGVTTKIDGLTLKEGDVYTIDFTIGHGHEGYGIYMLLHGAEAYTTSGGLAVAGNDVMLKQNGISTTVGTKQTVSNAKVTASDGVKYRSYRLVVDVTQKTLKAYVLTDNGYTETTAVYSGFDFGGTDFYLTFHAKAGTGKSQILSDMNIYKGDKTKITDEPIEPDEPVMDVPVIGDPNAVDPTYTVDFNNTSFFDWSVINTTGGSATVTPSGLGMNNSFSDKSKPVAFGGALKGITMEQGAEYTIDFAIGDAYQSGYADYINFKMNGNSDRGFAYLTATTAASNFVRETSGTSTVADNTFYYYEGTTAVFTPKVVESNGVNYTFFRVVADYDNQTLASYLLSNEGEWVKSVILTGCDFAEGDLYVTFTVRAAAGKSKIYRDIKIYETALNKNYYDVTNNIDGETEKLGIEKDVTEYELPKETKEGYMFMGWKVNGGEKPVKSGEKVEVASLESLEKVFVPVMSDIWCQVAKVYDADGVTDTGKRNVRFVSGIDSLDYEAIGYDVTVTYGGQSYTKNDFELKHVYSSLIANTSYGTEKITLESLEYNSNDGYIVAFVIKNVPTTVGEINVDLTPYQIIDGEKVQGNTIPLVLTAADLNK